MKARKIPELPKSDDDYWDGAETSLNTPKPVKICETHTKWQKHKGYIDNKDGTISCKFCGWGGILPGYMRVYNGEIIDLRRL
jgi:hypothetical protein